MNTNMSNQSFRAEMMERLDIGGAVIEYTVHGNGEPVLLIPPAGVIDGLGLPLFAEPELASRYQLIHYHRRGYMGSTMGAEPFTINLAASDVAKLLKHLMVKTAHIVGHSVGGVIALQLAVDAPNLVHSLALLEPSLPMVPTGNERLESLFVPVMNSYRSGNKQGAVEMFFDFVFGPNWKSIIEQITPGAVEQAVRDADVTVQELPAIQAWQFGPKDIAVIHQPVLSVLGTQSSPFMKKGRELIHSWFPQAEDFDEPTTHLLQMKDPQGVAHGLAEFFSRHPIVNGDPTPGKDKPLPNYGYSRNS